MLKLMLAAVVVFGHACKTTQKDSGSSVTPRVSKETKFSFTSDVKSSGLFLASKPQTVTIDLAVMPEDKKPSGGSANIAFCAAPLASEVVVGSIACANPKGDPKKLLAKHLKQKCTAALDVKQSVITPKENLPLNETCRSAKIEVFGFVPALQVIMEGND